MIMIHMNPEIVHKMVYGALAGWAAAAYIDFQAFQAWKSFDDAKTYQWKLALWRWVQGAVAGAVVGGGIFTVGV